MSFIEHLTDNDLRRMRKIVREAHMSHFPREYQTDYEADRIIESMAPEIVERFLRRGMNTHKIKKRIIIA